MKKILIIFFISLLSFTNANISKADDISIFQIDGLSIGQSALKIFSEEEILKGNQNYYKNKKYTTVRIDSSSSQYDLIEFSYLTNDKDYKLANIKGVKWKNFKMDKCLNEINQIFDETSLMFKNWNKVNIAKTNHNADPSGKSFQTWGGFFSNKGNVTMGCTDYSTDFGSRDHLDVSIRNQDFSNFLRIAYK